MDQVKATTPSKVTLDVGGRKFVTLASTLDESRFLGSLVSGRWDHDRQPDGSYFVDANPDLFEAILDYLRRAYMPLFWTPDKGHDFGRYQALRQEAVYYGISRLEKWLAEERYLQAVTASKKITLMTFTEDETKDVPRSGPGAVRQNVKVEWVDEPRWDCSSLIVNTFDQRANHGIWDVCDRSCMAYRYQKPSVDSCRVLKAVIEEDVVTFNPGVCDPR